ncbi:Ig-like domain-containing protein [Marinilabilia salmonicolor]|uniref:Putative secreted protein (Por secretion system target) n=1 Tax=Marinilabilia salmonicolor TaxID=989 RepID=A0A368UKA7_9BACT|nr:Ig-like domain-containing protein [Marinilabilia salmonicolor]RCW29113.1 putative secreted protein (Por secretion system target) [Marinilabilia salmonicolor]
MKKFYPLLIGLLVFFANSFHAQAQEPAVSTYSPTQDATGVPLDVVLELTFDVNIAYTADSEYYKVEIFKEGGIFALATYQISQGQAQPGLNISSKTLTITPSAIFDPESNYYIKIQAGAIVNASDATPFSGIDNSESNNWRFTTVSRPAVSTVSPAHNATGVTGLQQLSVTFNEEITLGANKNLTIKKSDGTDFQTINTTNDAGLISVNTTDNKTVEINHNAFNGDQGLYIDAEEGLVVSNASGVSSAAIDGTSSWAFTTATAPGVAEFGPASTPEAIVHADEPLTLRYDKPVTLASDKNVTIYSDGQQHFQTLNTTDNPAFFTYDSNTYTLTIDHNLFPAYSSIYVVVDEGLVTADDNDIASTRVDGLNQEWDFMTVAAPVLQEVAPNGITDVPGNQSLTLTYNENITAGDNKNLYIYDSTDQLIETINTTDNSANFSITDNTLTVTHSPLSGNTSYYILTDKGLAKSANTAMEADAISVTTDWTFTTTGGPVAETFTPSAAATGISITSPFSIDFNENIVRGTSGSLTIRESDETVVETIAFDSEQLTFVNDILTISHSALSSQTTYHIQIESNLVLSDATGTPWEGISDQSWSFTTAGAPTISSYDPLNGETSAPVNQPLTLTFSENIKRGNTGYLNIRRDDGSPNGVAFKAFSFDDPDLVFSNNTLSINHDLLISETTYFVKIDPGVIVSEGTDVAFGGIADNNQWRFTTAAPPTATSFDPVSGSELTSATGNLTITFSENIELGSSGAIRIKYGADATFQTITFDNTENISITDDVLTISHLEFPPSESFYILMDAGFVRSTASGVAFPGIQETTTWTFTSPAGPAISTYDPANNSLDIPVDAQLVLTFDQPIARGTGNMVLHYQNGGGDAVIVSAASENKLTINANTLTFYNLNMPHEETLYVTMDAGFVKSADTGFAFDGITDNTEWVFTTLPEPPSWITGYPVFSSITTDNINLDLQTNIDSRYYFVISESEAAPTVEQIVAGKLSETVDAVVAGDGPLTANTIFTHTGIDISETKLPSGSYYYMHLVAKHTTKDLYSKRNTLLIDKVAPVTSVFPADGTDYFPQDGKIKITFDEKIFDNTGTEYDNTNLTGLIGLTVTDGGTSVTHSVSIDTSGKEITVTPSADLQGRTGYTITVNQVYDQIGNGQTVSTVTTFTTDQLYTWTGAGTDATVWTDPNNWEGQPQGGYTDGSVYIPNTVTSYPEISGDITIYNLNIEPGASLTHSSGILSVNGEFRLQSSDQVNASYIYAGGSLTVTPDSVKIEQAISANNRNYNVSSPTNGATKADMGVTNKLFEWSNGDGSFLELGETETLQPGHGYLTRSEVGKIIFSGNINLADVNIPVQWSSAGKGWNLVGNPYPASLDWANITKTNVADGFWLWDNIQNLYGVYNQELETGVNLTSSVIPSNHAFFVKVPAEMRHLESSITFEVADVQNNENSYLKSAGFSPASLKLAGSNGEVRDETAIVLHPDASDELDHLDSEKYLSRASATIELFVPVDGANIAINAIPDSDWKEKSIPLGFYAKETGSFQIEVSEQSIQDLDQLILTDHVENKDRALSENSSYAFDVNTSGTNTSRFTLKMVRKSVATAIQTPEKKQTDNCIVYTHQSQIIVETPDIQNLRYQLNDLRGRTLESGKLNAGSSHYIDTPNTGIYVVTILSDDGKEQHKVAVEN